MLLQSYMYIILHHQLFITAAACKAEEILRGTRICIQDGLQITQLICKFLSVHTISWIYQIGHLDILASQFEEH